MTIQASAREKIFTKNTKVKKTDIKTNSSRWDYHPKVIYDEKILDVDRALTLSVFLNPGRVDFSTFRVNFLFGVLKSDTYYSADYKTFDKNHFNVPFEQNSVPPINSKNGEFLDFIKKNKFMGFDILNLKYQLLNKYGSSRIHPKKDEIFKIDIKDSSDSKKYSIEFKKLKLRYTRVNIEENNKYDYFNDTYLMGRMILSGKQHSFKRIFQKMDEKVPVKDIADVIRNLKNTENTTLDEEYREVYQKINKIIDYSKVYADILLGLN